MEHPWIFATLYFPFLQVAPLYIWHSRPRSETLYQRMAVTAAAAATAAWVPTARLTSGTEALLSALGLRLPGLAAACMLPLGLTTLLFAGHLVMLGLSTFGVDQWLWQQRWTLPLPVRLRNWAAAPLLEEFIYRACLISYLLASGIRPSACIWLSPLLFAASHLHHINDMTRFQGFTVRDAAAKCAVQLTYTTVFGWLSAYFFVRTGHLAACVLPHAFCNLVGPPALPPPGFKRAGLVWTAYAIGIVGFLLLLKPLTRPQMFANN